MHVAEPATLMFPAKPWCEHNGPATTNGVVECSACIELLCEHPQYYNALRAKGLRTIDEAEREQREEARRRFRGEAHGR